jgi:hypothetical protein
MSQSGWVFEAFGAQDESTLDCTGSSIYLDNRNNSETLEKKGWQMEPALKFGGRHRAFAFDLNLQEQ